MVVIVPAKIKKCEQGVFFRKQETYAELQCRALVTDWATEWN